MKNVRPNVESIWPNIKTTDSFDLIFIMHIRYQTELGIIGSFFGPNLFVINYWFSTNQPQSLILPLCKEMVAFIAGLVIFLSIWPLKYISSKCEQTRSFTRPTFRNNFESFIQGPVSSICHDSISLPSVLGGGTNFFWNFLGGTGSWRMPLPHVFGHFCNFRPFPIITAIPQKNVTQRGRRKTNLSFLFRNWAGSQRLSISNSSKCNFLVW